MNEKFEMICRMTQLGVKNYVTFALNETHKDITVGDGFVFAKGTFPVLLVAHMDTVHDDLPDLILYNPEKDAVSSPNGIGGDDRCGIYMILEIVKKHNCSVLFCEDEESGGIGATKFIQTDLARELKFNYAIELDRKGKNDAVFYDCDNEDFEEFITKDFYDTAYGSFSDISVVAPFLGCAAVNLSCGYYNAHTKTEFVVLKEMERSIEEVCNILARTTEDDVYEYIESAYSGYYARYYSGSYYKGGNSNGYKAYGNSWYDAYDDVFELYYLIEYCDEKGRTNWFDTYAASKEEAVGKFLMLHPTLCYENVMNVMVDRAY